MDRKKDRKIKPRKCSNKACRAEFTPHPLRPLQSVCSPRCAHMVAESKRQRKERKDLREGREKMKTYGDFIKEAEEAMRFWVREVQHGEGCISCGTQKPDAQYQGGHFLPKARRPELRFTVENIHLQCARCNGYLKGNVSEYRRGLVAKIGHALVDWLESPHEPLKLSRGELEDMKKHYNREARRIKRAREQGEVIKTINAFRLDRDTGGLIWRK